MLLGAAGSTVEQGENYPLLSNNPDDYEIGEAIGILTPLRSGFGSSAIVYIAVYKPTGNFLSIKMIDLDRFERNQIDELRKEIQVMSLCRHPNLLAVLSSFVYKKHLWIITPFLSGGSCLDILKNYYPSGLDESVIATILKQALQGLAYLHNSGHIHRDIKAGNLLIDKQSGVVKLADFGVSASFLEDGERQGVRKTFVGTPCWMAPETCGYNSKADIWSFGITALELALGAAPFAKYPPMKVIYMTLTNQPPTLERSKTKHKYSKSFKEMIDSCLVKDPSKRPNAEMLLKHSFFKSAKKPSFLVSGLLAQIPFITERNVSGTCSASSSILSSLSSSSNVSEVDPDEKSKEVMTGHSWDFYSETEDHSVGDKYFSEPDSILPGSTQNPHEANQYSLPMTFSLNNHHTEGGTTAQNQLLEVKKGRFSILDNGGGSTSSPVSSPIMKPDVEVSGDYHSNISSSPSTILSPSQPLAEPDKFVETSESIDSEQLKSRFTKMRMVTENPTITSLEELLLIVKRTLSLGPEFDLQPLCHLLSKRNITIRVGDDKITNCCQPITDQNDLAMPNHIDEMHHHKISLPRIDGTFVNSMKSVHKEIGFLIEKLDLD